MRGNFMRYDNPIAAALDILKRAKNVGALATLSTMSVPYLTSEQEAGLIVGQLAKELASELVDHELITRAIEADGHGSDRVEYRIELAVMTRADLVALRDAMAQAQIERVIRGDRS